MSVVLRTHSARILIDAPARMAMPLLGFDGARPVPKEKRCPGQSDSPKPRQSSQNVGFSAGFATVFRL